MSASSPSVVAPPPPSPAPAPWPTLGPILTPLGGLTVAIDHGLGGVPKGLERPVERLVSLVAGGPDAVLCSLGLARAHGTLATARGVAVVIALDTPVFEGGAVAGWARVATPSQAAAAGAVCAKILLQLAWGPEERARQIRAIADAIAEADAVGLPLMVEPVALGPARPPDRATEHAWVADGCRIAAEMGAAVLKVPFTTGDHLAEIVAGSCCPVTVLGGPATSPDAFLGQARAAVTAGARGIVAGRNVWGAADPLGVVSGLRAVLRGPSVA